MAYEQHAVTPPRGRVRRVRWHWWTPPVVVVVTVASVAGCASVPLSGPVHAAPERAATAGTPYVRVVPGYPLPGAEPAAVVRGWLSAMASYQTDGYRVARTYLTDAASVAWKTGSTVTVYADRAQPPRVTTVHADGGTAVVRIDLPVLGELVAGHTFTPQAGPSGQVRRIDLTLRQVAGAWRIDEAPPGLYMGALDVEREFVTRSAHYLRRDGRFVVGEPYLQPVVSDTPAAAVRRSLRGPEQRLAPAVDALTTRNTRIALREVREEGDDYVVDLSPAAADLRPARRTALAVQVAAALEQLGGRPSGVRLLSDGDGLDVPGSLDGRVTFADLRAYEPDLDGADDGVYVLRAGATYRLGADAPVAVAGPLGRPGAARAVSAGAVTRSLHAITADGRSVVTWDEDRERLLTDRRADRVLAVTGDRAARLWVAASATADAPSRLWVRRSGGRWTAVDGPPGTTPAATPSTTAAETSSPRTTTHAADAGGGTAAAPRPAAGSGADGGILDVALAPDAVHIAVVVGDGQGGSTLWTGVVVDPGPTDASGAVRVVGWQRSPLDDRAVRSIAWRDDTSLVGLGSGHAGRGSKPLVVDVPRNDVTHLTGVDDATAVSVMPGRPVVVGTGRGVVLRADVAGDWNVLGTGSAPVYAE